MDAKTEKKRIFDFDLGITLRRAVISWLAAAATEYIMIPGDVRSLTGLLWLDAISPVRLAIVALAAFALLTAGGFLLGRRGSKVAGLDPADIERLLLAMVFATLAIVSLTSSFSLPFAVVCVLIAGALFVYALFGWDPAPTKREDAGKSKRVYLIVTGALVAAFVIFDSVWTVCRGQGLRDAVI